MDLCYPLGQIGCRPYQSILDFAINPRMSLTLWAGQLPNGPTRPISIPRIRDHIFTFQQRFVLILI